MSSDEEEYYEEGAAGDLDISDGSESYVDLEGSMDLSDVEDLEGSVESSLEISSPIDDFTLKAPLRDLIKISCLRYGMPTYKFQLFKWKRHRYLVSRRLTPEGDNETTRNQKVPFARSGHRMVFHNGRIYAFGGYNPKLPEGRQLFREMWEYNIATRRWKLIQMHGTVPQNLASHTACIVDDNDSATAHAAKMLVYGGTGTPFGINMSRGAFLCNLHGGFRWTRLKVRAAQDIHVTDGSVAEITFGDGDEERLDNNDTHPHLPRPLYGQAIAMVNDSTNGPQLYSIGGTSGFDYFIDVDRLIFRHRRWEACYRSEHDENRSNSEPVPRYRHELAVRNGLIYLLGGGTSFAVHDFVELWIFDTTITSKPQPRLKWSNASIHPDLQVRHRGRSQMGRGGWIKTKTVPDPTVPPEMNQHPPPRRCHGAVQQGRYAYIFGGYDGENIFGDLWRLDLDSLEWKQLPKEMAEAVYFHGTTITPAGQLITFGGVTSVDSNERSDKVHSLWLNIPSLRDMAWQAILHYLPDIGKVGLESLREAGIPFDLIENILDEPNLAPLHPNHPVVG